MKKTYHNNNLKEKIVSEVYRMITKDGYKTVTIRKIGSNLDVSSAAIYRHFKNLEEVMKYVVLLCSTNFSRELMINVNKNDNYIEQINHMANNFINFSIHEENQFDFMFFSSYTREMNNIALDSNEHLPGVKVLIEFLEQLKQDLNLRFDSKKMFVKLWSFILGYSILIKLSEEEANSEILFEAIHGLINEEEMK